MQQFAYLIAGVFGGLGLALAVCLGRIASILEAERKAEKLGTDNQNEEDTNR